MSTQPRISAPIGRLKIRASPRKKAESSVGRIQAAEPACDLEADDHGMSEQENTPPRYYPFAPRLTDDRDD